MTDASTTEFNAKGFKWISFEGEPEGLTINPNLEDWQPEQDVELRKVGVLGRYTGKLGSGRFGVKAMDDKELARNYFALSRGEVCRQVRVSGGEGAAQLSELYVEAACEVERRYFRMKGIPAHFTDCMQADWSNEHYDEMAQALGAK